MLPLRLLRYIIEAIECHVGDFLVSGCSGVAAVAAAQQARFEKLSQLQKTKGSVHYLPFKAHHCCIFSFFGVGSC